MDPGERQPAIRLVHRPGVSDAGGRRLARGPVPGYQPVACARWGHAVPGVFHHGARPDLVLLRRAGLDRARNGFLQAQRLYHGRPALRKGRSSARRRVHPVLHGDQHRGVTRAAGLRLAGGGPTIRMVLRLRRGRSGDGGGTDVLPAYRSSLPSGRGPAPGRPASSQEDGRALIAC
jgi:hypothetical protein